MKTFAGLTAVYNAIRVVLDIGILTFVIYQAYMLLRRTNGIQIIRAGVILAFAYVMAYVMQLDTLLWLLRIIGPALMIAFAIVFQPEIRKLFLRMGQTQWFAFNSRGQHTYIDSVLIAASELSQLRRGMLCVFLRHTRLDDIMESGVYINADLSSNLLVTIFKFDTPLHDGACFVQGNKVLAAGCFIEKLSEQADIKKTFGTRHRAGLGLAEKSDAVVLVVSEETGAISLAYDSELHYDMKVDEITRTLERLLNSASSPAVETKTIETNKGADESGAVKHKGLSRKAMQSGVTAMDGASTGAAKGAHKEEGGAAYDNKGTV